MFSKKIVFFILFLSFLLGCSVVRADQPNSVSVRLPVRCIAKDINHTFNYVLEQEKSEGNKENLVSLTLKNGEVKNFVLSYSEIGIFHYKIRQTDTELANVVLDKTVYNIDVYVEERGQGSLYAEAVIYKENSSSKSGEAVFTNVKEPEPNTEASKDKNNGNSGKNRNKKTNNVSELDTSGVPDDIKTGDTTPILPYVIVLVSSLVVILLIVVKYFKSRKC